MKENFEKKAQIYKNQRCKTSKMKNTSSNKSLLIQNIKYMGEKNI